MLPELLIFVLVCYAQSGETKTSEEWKKLMEKSAAECIGELKLENEMSPSFSMRILVNLTQPEEFSENLKCITKCVAEKFNGQELSNAEAFIERDIETARDVLKAENLSPTQIDSYVQANEPCYEKFRRSGRNDCDTYLTLYLCSKGALVEIMQIN
ncbi:uncharacterized protein LOC132200946 [Neocloeon triangulifer]|uniref:uncharacterized protein LOC132200946 n=1 Tax=Neocloeon triangulifer TaxID=2078957 RepID=UPI00286F636C|nr:uncharacterized protein LOC132200946 [Neocloeon triangulifer]